MNAVTPASSSQTGGTSGQTLRIQLQDAPSDLNRLARVLRPVVGEHGRLTLDLFKDVVTIDGADVGATAVLEALRAAEMPGTLILSDAQPRRQWPALVVAATFVVAAMLIDRSLQASHDFSAVTLEAIGQHPVIVRVLCGVAIATGITMALPNAWNGVRRRTVTVDAVAILMMASALGLGAWFTGASVAVLNLMWDTRARR